MARQKKSKQKTNAIKAPQKNFALKTGMDTLNDTLRAHFKIVLAGLFVLSLVISSWYYQQGKDSPLRSIYLMENSDMAFFHDWASYLAKGNWWCDTVMHPYHDWHDAFATLYLQSYPEVADSYYQNIDSGAERSELAAKKALINDIYKGKTFHQEPLYAYLIAVSYAIFGKDHKWVYFWTFLLAALTSVLVYLIGKNQFNELTGLLGALFVSLCGTILVYQMVLFRTTLTNFFTVLLLYVFLKLLEKPNRRWVALFGIISGMAILSQSYVIIFIAAAMVWFGWVNRQNLKQLGVQMAIFLGCMLFVLLPLLIRNYRSEVPLIALASHGAMTYIPNNTTFSKPMESFNVHIPTLVKLRHDGEGKMIPTAILCLKSFTSFGDFWRIYKQKINGMFMWHELPNNMNYFLYKEFAPVLGQLPIRYYFIAPLGLIGLLFGLYKQRWKITPFLLMTLTCVVPLMIAGNLARIRSPFVILMAIAAAFCLVEIAGWIRSNNWKPVMIGTGLVFVSFLYTVNTPPKHVFEYSTSDLSVMYIYHFRDKLMALEQANDNKGYLEETTKLMEYIPDYFFESGLQDNVWSQNESDACMFVVNLIRMHAATLQELNRQEEANFYNQKADTLYARANNFNEILN